MSKGPLILIVEDEAPIRQLLRFALEPEGFRVREADNTQAARHEISLYKPELIVVDWMLPGESGIEFIKHLKKNKQTHTLPIILLTARAEESNKLQGFDAGSDDYVTKPFSPRELIARIKSILRRGVILSPEGTVEFENLQINTHAHEVKINDQSLNLSHSEYQLLLFFITHPNKVFNREQLLDQLNSHDQEVSDRSIDALIRRLRARLKPHGYDHYIQTMRSVGYRWGQDE